MANEQVVEKKYRVLNDPATGNWDVISFWTKAGSVVNNNGKTLEQTVGDITGVSDDVSTALNTDVISAKAIKKIDNKFGQLSFKTLSDGTDGYVKGGVFFPFAQLSLVASGNVVNTLANSDTKITLDYASTYLMTCNIYKTATPSGNRRASAILITTLPKDVAETSSSTLTVPLVSKIFSNGTVDADKVARGVIINSDNSNDGVPGLSIGSIADGWTNYYSIIKIQ